MPRAVMLLFESRGIAKVWFCWFPAFRGISSCPNTRYSHNSPTCHSYGTALRPSPPPYTPTIFGQSAFPWNVIYAFSVFLVASNVTRTNSLLKWLSFWGAGHLKVTIIELLMYRLAIRLNMTITKIKYANYETKQSISVTIGLRPWQPLSWVHWFDQKRRFGLNGYIATEIWCNSFIYNITNIITKISYASGLAALTFEGVIPPLAFERKAA